MTTLATSPEPEIAYPDSDGKPMAENTVQFRWITTIQGNLDLLFHDRSDVFVAGDDFWYPVKGEPGNHLAPNVYVVFGRPKGDRSSYKQWEEGGIPLSVVCEVLSPGNTVAEMNEKFEFYEHYGVLEYYIIDPVGSRTKLDIYEREGEELKSRRPTTGTDWVSPLLGVHFVETHTDVKLYYPNGKPFLTFVELGELQKRTEQSLEFERARAELERQRAESMRERAEVEAKRADAERERAETEREQAKAERERAAKLAARLRELGFDPDAI